MHALISPQETIFNVKGEEIGYRVAQVSVTTFPMAEPFYWIKCSNKVKAETHYYDKETEKIVEKPVPVTAPSPTLEQLQAQLAVISAQINALANTSG